MGIFGASIVALGSQIDVAGTCLAYLDPGSGSMILQILVVGLAGLGVLFKYAGARILDIVWPFRQGRPHSSEAAPPQTAGTDDRTLDNIP